MEHHTTLASLEPDAFVAVCGHLQHREVASLAASCAALHHAVWHNDRLWASLYQRQFPQPWARLTQRQAIQQGQQHAGSGVAPGAWRETFLRTHDACYQLCSTDPLCREWTTDASTVHLAAIHGSGEQRLTLTAQGSGVELRCAPEVAPDKSLQLYGHTARVSSAAVLHPAGFSAAAVHRIGVVTGSHDQTVRLWTGNCDPDSWEFRNLPLNLLTPLRTLRGHQEAVTALQLMTSNTGVTIAATGSKDRTVRLWGLAPLVPSPVQKPGIATLRGHGAPITCLAMAGGTLDGSSTSSSSGSASSSRAGSSGGGSAASGSWLLSGSLDARVKQWDAFHGSCIGTAKCGMPIAACQPAAAAPELQPHTLLVSGGTQVQLLDLRCLRPVAGVAVPAERGEAVHCFCQQGWDLAVGSSDGARVFDIRQLPSLGSSSGAAAGSTAAAGPGLGRGAPERLRLVGHARPVTSIHVDRLKVVTATDRYGPGPVRVWCADTGEPLAELDSCLPPAQPQPGPEPVAQGAGLEGGNGAGQQPGAAAEPAAGADGGDQEEGGSPAAAARRPAHQYRRGWEGVTALACQGALLVSGSSEGGVVERDFSRGGLPELEAGEAWSAGAALAGKFWALLG